MFSMTGYGKASAEKEGKKVTVELKSVNHRFLDLSIKLPKTFNFADDIIRKAIQDAFSRGHIDVYVNYENTRGEPVNLSVNEMLADEYVEIAKNLSEKYGIINDFSTTSLLRMQDVIIQQTVAEDEEELVALTKEATLNAIVGLKEMRAKEGISIKADILGKLNLIETMLKEIIIRAPGVVNTYRDKLAVRIKEILGAVAIDENKLINEVAFYSDKIAIDEETSRLSAHIVNTRDILKLNEPIGKKLDFIVQEFNREANTIGSKCNDLSITGYVLSLKNEIEKIREQVQNIE